MKVRKIPEYAGEELSKVKELANSAAGEELYHYATKATSPHELTFYVELLKYKAIYNLANLITNYTSMYGASKEESLEKVRALISEVYEEISSVTPESVADFRAQNKKAEKEFLKPQGV